MFKKEIKENEKLLIEILEKLVSYKSIENLGEQGTIFGVENKKCLNEYLNIAKQLGFKTKNLDDYCGYAEYGTSSEIIGVATHLDVVPVTSNWNTDPFKLTMKDGYLYGRGTSDDKGATVASLIALKIIKDNNIKLNKKIRLIVGCNEETQSLCMKHYMEKEGPFDLGFTPDAIFPCINGEKGIIHLNFNCCDTKIIDINGGIASNIVPDICNIKINNDFDIEPFKKYLDNKNIKYTIENNSNIFNITVHGKSTHASTPESGINAITYALYALNETNIKDNFIKEYCNLIDLENNGSKLKINFNDKYSTLTLVNGTIKKEDKISGTLDIRVPITIDNEVIINKINEISSIIEFIPIMKKKSLYYHEDSILIKSLMKAYQEVTNDYTSKPQVIGGGTYAKSLENCVAFGCEFNPNQNNIHEDNERVSIEELLLQVELYIKAMVELAK